ncbi:cytochrome c oxidase subunit via protein [Rutstroemia sp. NJR-2017a BVV2]|nr:cytochrome c oxidase subunit via protein [Rutstroemia sp. NJR-2017a BVV2]PQE19659.1 cytochrome c oxidase subunit via protein [Rutstroemia sp. NJR-2017a BVV2]
MSQRFAAQLRPQSIRTPFQRRFASSESGFTGAEDNAFNRERKAVKDHAAATSVNAYNLWEEHWAHWNHMAPLEERPEYPYQNIRTKNYFWGDGDKASEPCGHLWNEKVNYHKKPE